MKITVRAALEMLQAIQQLDSYQNGGEKPSLYKYGGDTRLQIAIARRKLRAIQEDYVDARNAMLLELTDGSGDLPPIEAGPNTDPVERRAAVALHMEYNKRERELQAGEIDIDIKPLPVARFNLDENPIPAGVLDGLGDFIHADG